MATQYIDIPIFGGGLVTNADFEDIPKDSASDTSNLDLDVYGKLKKRKPRSLTWTISGSHFGQLLNWITSTGASHWVGYETQNKNIEFWSDEFVKEHSQIKDLTDANVTDIKIINFGDEVRFANSLEEKAAYISHTVRQFFLGTYNPCDANFTDTGMDTNAISNTSQTTISFSGTNAVSPGDYIRIDSEVMLVTSTNSGAGPLTVVRERLDTSSATHSSGVNIYFADTFIMADAAVSYPSTWVYQTITEGTGDMGANAIGYYYYKFVPVFDGNQEAPFGDAFAKYHLTTAEKPLKIGLQINTGNMSRRMTAIKMYKSYDESDHTPVYEHAKTVSVNTADSSGDISKTSSTSEVATFFYDPDAPFHSLDVGKWIKPGTGASSAHHYQVSAVSDSNKLAVVDAYYTSGAQTFTGVVQDGWNGNWVMYADTGSDAPDTASGTVKDGDSGYYGMDTAYDINWDWDNDEKVDWIVKKSTAYRIIDRSFERVIRTSEDFASNGNTQSLELTNGYYFTPTTGIGSSTAVTMYAYDSGILQASAHPLGGVTKATVNYKYGQYINGRFFVGNVRLDPDSAAEDHPNWIIYSELNQPDILPITNYIQIKDDQGGSITGLQKLFDDLAVFMERGVFRLHIPSDDPGAWTLLESNENVGCIAPNSIVKVGGNIFFAGGDYIYSLDSSFNVVPLTDSIKDDYQGSTALASTRGIYDPKKQRILFTFGSGTRYVYSLNLLHFQSGKPVWNKHDMGTTIPVDMMAIDNDLNLYTIHNTTD